jgi:hypothetical protein
VILNALQMTLKSVVCEFIAIATCVIYVNDKYCHFLYIIAMCVVVDINLIKLIVLYDKFNGYLNSSFFHLLVFVDILIYVSWTSVYIHDSFLWLRCYVNSKNKGKVLK